MAKLTAAEKEMYREREEKLQEDIKNTKGPLSAFKKTGKLLEAMPAEGGGHIIVGIGALIYYSIGSGVESVKELTKFVINKFSDEDLEKIDEEQLEEVIEEARKEFTTAPSQEQNKNQGITKK